MIAEAMVLTGPRSLQRRQMTIPDVGDRGAILRVEACGLCGTDHEQFTGHLPAGFGGMAALHSIHTGAGPSFLWYV